MSCQNNSKDIEFRKQIRNYGIKVIIIINTTMIVFLF